MGISMSFLLVPAKGLIPDSDNNRDASELKFLSLSDASSACPWGVCFFKFDKPDIFLEWKLIVVEA